MATYYWVGGSGTWDNTTTTNWSLTSGGAGGAGVPTTADNVIFDSASNATGYTVTLGTKFSGTASYSTITSMTSVVTVATVTSGTLAVGDIVYIGSQLFRITSFGTGAGGTGTYNCSVLRGTNSSGKATTNSYSCSSSCFDFTASAPASGTITFTSSTGLFAEVAGSFTLNTGSTTSGPYIVTTGTSTHTITTNSISMSFFYLCGTGTYTLGSSFNVVSYLYFSLGTFTTNNYALTSGAFDQDSSGTRTINLGSSTVTISNASYPIGSSPLTVGFGTNVTFNAGTSQVNFTGSSCFYFTFGNKTWYNFSLTSTTINAQTNGGVNLSYSTADAPTFNNFSIASQSGFTGVAQVFLNGDITINGTFTISATAAPTTRLMIQSKTLGTVRTITTAAFAAGATDVDWRDITIAGGAGTISGTRFGNCLGCTNITFDVAKTVYWNLAGAQQWSATGWATSSGGSPAAANFPLSQDTAVFDNTGSVTGTISLQGGGTNLGWNVGSIDMSGRTSAMTLSIDSLSFPRVYGSWTNGSGTTISGTGQITFANRSIKTINSAGKTFTQSIVINTPSGGIQLLTNNLTFSDYVNLINGTLDLNNLSLTSTLLYINTSGTTTSIAFGTSGVINLSGNGGTILQILSTTFTYTGTSRINLTNSGSIGTRNFNVNQGVNSPNIYVTAGSDIIDIALTSGYAISGIDFTGFTGSLATSSNAITLYGSLTLGSGMTVSGYTGTMTFAAASGTQTVTTNGVTINNPIVASGGGSFAISGALTSSSTFTSSGTKGTSFNSATATFSSVTLGHSGLLSLSSGGLVLTGSGTCFSDTVFRSSFSSFSTSAISATSSSPKTLSFFPNNSYAIINQGGSGALTLTTSTGIGTIKSSGLKNSVQPATISITGGLTVSGANLQLNGTGGNLITLGSTNTTPVTLQSPNTGVQTATFCSVSYITGSNTAGSGGTGVLWRFLNSTNGGNNTNLTFASQYYWVGGSGTWDNTLTTNWSLTSAGAGGTGPPTSADDVVFNSSSNATAYTVTMGTGAVCFNMTMAGPLTGQVTWAGSTDMNIYGSMTLSGTAANGGVNVTQTGTTTFSGTYPGLTITTNGVSITFGINFNGVGGTWSLGSAFTTNNLIDITNGTFDTSSSNYSVTSSSAFRVVSNGTRGLTLNGSTITCVYFGVSSATGLTFTAGTSTINMTAPLVTFFLGGLTFYNVVFNVNNVSNSSYSILDSVTNTFNTFQFNASSTSPSFSELVLYGNITTANLYLNLSSNGQTNRLFVHSDTIGTQRTITWGPGSAGLSYCDFRDISASANLTAGNPNFGDCGGNSGLTFAAGKTVYWNLAGSQNWSATGWATSSGGAPAAANFPLAQDTAHFDNVNSAGTITIDRNWNIGQIDALNRSTPMTLATGTTSPSIYGSWYTPTAVTRTGTGTLTFCGRGFISMYISDSTSGTMTFTQSITLNAPSNILQMSQPLTTLGTFTLTQGTLNLFNSGFGSYNLTCQSFTSSNTNTRTIAFGTGNITLTGNGATILSIFTGTNLTVTGTPVFNATYSGATGTRVMQVNGITSNFPSLNVTAGTDGISQTGNWLNVDFTGFAGTLNPNGFDIYGNLNISTGMTISADTNGYTFRATSGTKTITTNGKTLDTPITFNGVGGTWQLQDNLTTGSTRTTTLTNGTLDLNGKTYNSGTSFVTATGTKNLTFNGGTLVCPAVTTTAFNNAVPTGFTTTAGTGTGYISMTGATAKTFVGGGSTYNCTLSQDGAGALTITGSNTFNNIANTTQPASVLFTAGTTNTFTNFNLSGTAGNLITIGSVTAASHTLSKSSGTVSISYCSISRSTATGGAKWSALNNNGNVDGGNNTGWIFSLAYVFSFFNFFDY